MRVTRSWSLEEGSAQVEFLGVILALVIPVAYLIVALSEVQAARYAASSAAQSVARSFAIHGEKASTSKIAELAFKDQGFDVPVTSLQVKANCLGDCTDGGLVKSEVGFTFSIPGLGWTGTRQVTVTAEGQSYMGQLRSRD